MVARSGHITIILIVVRVLMVVFVVGRAFLGHV
jgi:hypothetical protein